MREKVLREAAELDRQQEQEPDFVPETDEEKRAEQKREMKRRLLGE